MITANDYLIQSTRFPDGTSQVWQLPTSVTEAFHVNVVWQFEEERELIDLYSLRWLLKDTSMSLHMPFMPYSRQDKDVGNHQTFNFYMFAAFIESLCCIGVSSVDVHNPVLAGALISRFRNISVAPIIEDVIRSVQPDLLVYPDQGAATRYRSVPTALPSIHFTKVRDQSSGKVLETKCSHEYFVKDGQKLLIVDDICDGGATFLQVADKLRGYASDLELHLFVTHGIFSKGRQVLTDAGIRVYTTNSLVPNNVDGYEV